MSWGGTRSAVRTLTAIVGVTALTALSSCSADPDTGDNEGGPQDDSARADATVYVPQDAETINDAVDLVEPGGLIVIGPGTYEESVLIDVEDVTVRGEDRNEVVIDGGGVRPFGISAIADGVSVENLTVTDHTFYGVLVTGLHDENGPAAHGGDGYSTFDPEDFPPVQRFRFDHITAYNNGLYGLYAFNAQQGTITESYASGHADSGIYVGQCQECWIDVSHNVAENNAVGFENANASELAGVRENRFTHNRVGMTFLSNYREAFHPQQANTVHGNLVGENAEPHSPAQAEGAFGVGIGIGAGTLNRFVNNRIENNPSSGVTLSSEEDLAPVGNRIAGNAFSTNGVDIANIAGARAPAADNCNTDAPSTEPDTDDDATLLPEDLFSSCSGTQPAIDPAELPQVEVPSGVSFRQIDPPPAQPTMQDEPAARELGEIAVTDDVAEVPGSDYLAERSRHGVP
ncbi:right-handed parallel beta-helix repeat-containing protein [Nesterenkonia muleiensis]|uniref:right-handed parallel beta-helix repeat-containing protein n=1 Tax=Nesterenkonia muleiensis TaxID=2282648 RepID=UPI000E75EB6D|nr:right-handed parallel beta-helix repeat-containing protein [Nesterenkonia muleiensis]